MPDPRENIKNLHKNLTNTVSGFSVPFKQFEQDMLDESKRQRLYGNMSTYFPGFNKSFEEFSSDIIIQTDIPEDPGKKKDPTLLPGAGGVSSESSLPEDLEAIPLTPEEKELLSRPEVVHGEPVAQESTQIEQVVPLTEQQKQENIEANQRLEETDAEVKRQREERFKELDNGISRSKNALNAMSKSIISNLAEVPKSIGVLAKTMTDKYGSLGGPEENAKIEEYATYQFGKKLQDWAEELFPTNPALQEDFVSSTLPQGAGSLVAIALGGTGRGATSLLTKGAAKTMLRETEKNLLRKGIKDLAKRAGTGEMMVGGFMMGTPEYEKAKEAGSTDEEAFEVFVKNFLIGQTDAIPLGITLNRINKLTKGGVIKILNEGFQGGVNEGIQEVTQNYLTNLTAKNTYDEFRNLYEGMATDGAAGFVLGAILGSAGAVAKNLPSKEKKQMEDYIAEKQQVLDEILEDETITDEGLRGPAEVGSEAIELGVESGKTGDDVSTQKPKAVTDDIKDTTKSDEAGDKAVVTPKPDSDTGTKKPAQKKKKVKPIYNNKAVQTGEKRKKQQSVNPELSDLAYDAVSLENAKKEAERVIKNNQLEEVEKVVLDKSNDMIPPLRDALALEVATAYQDQGNTDAFLKMMDAYSEIGTERAQGLSVRQLAAQNPKIRTQQIVANAIKSNRGLLTKKDAEGKSLQGRIGESFSRIKEIAQKEGIKVTENDKVDAVIDKIVTKRVQASKGRIRVSKEKIAKARAQRKQLTDEFKKKKHTLFLSSAIPGLTPEGIEYAGKVAKTYIDEGIANIEVIVGTIKKHFKKHFDRDLSDEDMSKIRAKFLSDVATKQVKDFKKDIKDIVKEHYSKRGELKGKISEKLTEQLGLDTKEAQQVQNAIQKEFDAQVKAAARKEMTNSLGKSTIPKKKISKQEYQKVIEAINEGVFTEDIYKDLLADKVGLVNLNSQEIKTLEDLADKAQTTPEGFQRRRATERFMNHLERMKLNFDTFWGNVNAIPWMSIWYANALSGISTQQVNITANMFETLGEVYVQSVKNPKKAPQLWISLYQGWGRGTKEALSILKTGFSSEKGGKWDLPSDLERIRFKGGKWNPYNYAKFVRRFMAAADTFFFFGLKEMRSKQLAMGIAEASGKSGREATKMANEILYNTTERKKEAESQAKKEGLSGNDFDRRVFEIMEQSRPQDINEDASDYAAHGTFNYDPEGFLGDITNLIAAATEIELPGTSAKPLKFVVPFTRVISNVANRYIEWTPYGYVRALRGEMGKKGRSTYRKLSKDQRTDLVIKATTGLLAMTTLWFMSDDEDGIIEITANGTGKFSSNYELNSANGWQDYSIRIGNKWISYQNTPLAIPLSIIGFLRDAEKYKGEKDLTDKFSLTMMASIQYIMDMTSLSSLSEFFDIFQEKGDPFKAANKLFTKSAKTFVVPNLATQVSKSIQEINDMPIKEANNFGEHLTRDMPFLRDRQNNIYNALGEPVTPQQLRRFVPLNPSQVRADPVWTVIVENNAFIGRPRRNTMIYINKQERELTDKEYNEYARLSGVYTKELLQKNLSKIKNKETKEKRRQLITNLKSSARKKAKAQIYNMIKNNSAILR